MSVALTSYPVVTSSGKVRNIFAGFQAVELEFKREDIAIVTVSQGANNKILIDISGDFTTDLNVGEWVYLFAEGATFTYDNSFQILDVTFNSPNTEITVNGDYIENASTGYCNYKQNWFLEAKLVNPDNNDILNYPQLLQNDGNPNGEIEVNVSMLVDFLKNEILSSSQEITDGRQECQVMYRESWREDDTDTFTLVDQESIIIIFAAEDSEIEDFVNGFEIPKMWEGYPFLLNVLHSLENYSGERVSISFDELDINKDDIILDTLLTNFNPSAFGILQANFNDNIKVIESNTRYIRFNANSSGNADYETGDYDDDDYQTINTP
ncbi:hypothetical protein KAR91_64730 [Candidatus Pacearchaeota archaeon]|nr:hypothetical protein [Candidatus Pacearchaeota archaeon]